MVNLNLEVDEYIVLESEDAIWNSRDYQDIDNLLLSNKKLYCFFKKSNGLFKKATDELCVFSLDEIKIIDGKAIVQAKKYEDENCLQIQFKAGIEYFSFDEESFKTIQEWVVTINEILGTEAILNNSIKDSLFSGSLGDVVGNFKNIVGSATQTIVSNTKQHIEKETDKTSKEHRVFKEKVNHIPNAHKFCTNCGEKLNEGMKFCPSCGMKTDQDNNERINHQGAQRKQTYVGDILKCPNCGEVISSIDVICPSCGHQITGRAGSSSVQHLVSELMIIENSRKQKNVLDNLVQSFTGNDDEETSISSKKITLIKNFPIPNTIEEITEFVILAAGNIDVNLSKSSFGNKFGRMGNDFKANERGISDAWVGKLQQAYQKAEFMFSDTQMFKKIQEIYIKKMKELNMFKD